MYRHVKIVFVRFMPNVELSRRAINQDEKIKQKHQLFGTIIVVGGRVFLQ